jgi:3-methyladenine DNA glycosylase/8-oxoguanine DNA glycosylase
MTPYRELSRDPVLRKLIRDVGEPDPFAWPDGGRTGGDNFAALVLHIVGQQISTAVAFTLFDRIRDALAPPPYCGPPYRFECLQDTQTGRNESPTATNLPGL